MDRNYSKGPSEGTGGRPKVIGGDRHSLEQFLSEIFCFVLFFTSL